MDKQIIEPLSLKAQQPLWLRVTLGIVLFLVVGAVYFIVWGFWVGMSHWADTVPNTRTSDQFYLEYIWGPLLLIFLIVPTILTFLNIRWRLKIVYWLTSFVLALISWFVWFIVIEAASK